MHFFSTRPPWPRKSLYTDLFIIFTSKLTFYNSDHKETSGPAVTDVPAPQTIEDSVEHAKRAFALKKYEQAVDYYATALELAYVALIPRAFRVSSNLTRVFCSTEKYGEDAPESADLYFAYGKALLENAISQASVLGKEQQEDEGEVSNTNKGAFASIFADILSVSLE